MNLLQPFLNIRSLFTHIILRVTIDEAITPLLMSLSRRD